MGNGHTDHTGCMCNRKLSPQDYTMESLLRSVTPHLSTCMVPRPSMTTAILYVSVARWSPARSIKYGKSWLSQMVRPCDKWSLCFQAYSQVAACMQQLSKWQLQLYARLTAYSCIYRACYSLTCQLQLRSQLQSTPQPVSQ